MNICLLFCISIKKQMIPQKLFQNAERWRCDRGEQSLLARVTCALFFGFGSQYFLILKLKMVHFCFVLGCESCSRDLGVKFFQLPCDKAVRMECLNLIGRQHEELTSNVKSYKICSLHYPLDFHSWTCRMLQEQNSGCRCTPKDTLPSLKLPTLVYQHQPVASSESHSDSRHVFMKTLFTFEVNFCD
jgi:hypothetical protein